MSQTVNTSAEERDKWRARILRALAELRGETLGSHHDARDDDGDDVASSDALS